jgi:hypothetical protein
MAYGGGGDFALIADGSAAWIAYGSWDNGYRTDGIHAYFSPELNAGHQIAIQRLNERFTDVDHGVAPRTVTGPDQEAPTLFKRGDFFYLLHGDVCCFCPQGSDSKVLVATDPMGNWTLAGNLNPYGAAHVRVQSNAVLEVALANGSTAFVWTADQWGSALSGNKSRDTQVRRLPQRSLDSCLMHVCHRSRQFWVPLHFEETTIKIARGNVEEEVRVALPVPVGWVDQFELELGGSAAEGSCDAKSSA